MKLDRETLEWIEKNTELIQLLKNIEMQYGHIVIYFHEGKPSKYDICLRDRNQMSPSHPQ